ncbi:MAG: 2-oxo acid dehydrogenase subunit E2 [Rikenellaceae bacterium]|jgi:pyruvate dehydrogenase E2 component (dihydrolipoamide acetyltransferase)|nr:2-oxo acid dehydrogenase subunit E2 [Rikenellaceae bacterium]
MANVVIMPKQGQSVESCILTEFKKKKGDSVSKGDVLFAYETDKASFEETSQFDGVVLELFYGEGDEIPVLSNVMVIGAPGESTEGLAAPASAPAAAPAKTETLTVRSVEAAPAKATTSAPAVTPSVKPVDGAPAPISPRAKALIDKEFVDIASIAGTGPKGRIIERDVQPALENRPRITPLAKAMAQDGGAVPATGSGLAGAVRGADVSAAKNPVYAADSEVRPISNIRKLIAKAMHASLQNSAQLTHHLSADARRILELRKQVKAAVAKGYPVDITLNDMVCLAVIKALKKFPQVNTHFLGDSIRYFSKVHLALAVDTGRGLMVPVVRNADDLSIAGLANQLKEVANACKKGGIDPDLLSSEAATFTVSNLGNYGVEIFTPVINLPQSAILGVNTIVPRPKDLGGGVYGFAPHIGLSLTYDHRSLDGGEATRFLKQIAVEIENLEFELF